MSDHTTLANHIWQIADLLRGPYRPPQDECAPNSHGIVWDRLRLYWEGFRDIRIPLPPLDEQHVIVAHVAAETARLDTLRLATESTITLLKERRSALIAAAVTGR